MKHAGKARRAAWRLIFWTLVLLLALLAAGTIAVFVSKFIVAIAANLISFSAGLVALWLIFGALTLYFFRDPTPHTPAIPNAIVSPAHGKVDVIDEVTENEFMGGPCQRVSIFLSLLDVHVQKAPVRGKIAYLKHTPGKFRSTMKAASTLNNENALIGIEAADYPEQKLGVRLIAGWLARRVKPFVVEGEMVERGDRISLIQYGSRCDFYLPRAAKIHVRLGDKVQGGETIVATFE